MPASSRSLALVTRLRSTLPHTTGAVLGSALDLMIHSVEELRDRFGRLSVPGLR